MSTEKGRYAVKKIYGRAKKGTVECNTFRKNFCINCGKLEIMGRISFW